MDEMDSQFEEDWTTWAGPERRETISLPDEDVHALAHVLMAIRTAIEDGKFPLSYSGPLVDRAIRSWKPSSAQRFISARALRRLRKDGVKKGLCEEHDPPVSFYRDLVRYDVGLEHKRLSAYLRRLKITLITKAENKTLNDGKFKSFRPANAYQQCGIVRLPYDPNVPVARPRRRTKTSGRRRTGKV